jgi:N-hydroxyarylamine O-acetyltransferase
MSVAAYLQRIGLTAAEPPDLPFLGRLMEAHLGTVPFENLDIVAGRRIELEDDHLWDKVVVRRRGGYCYELNSLFRRLLEALGFDVSLVSGRVFNRKKQEFGPDFDHMALLVRLDHRTWLVDVGFGDSFRRPLALPDGLMADPGGRFRLRPGLGRPDRFCLEKEEGADWVIKYDFNTMARQINDFAAMNHYQQTSSQSLFAKGLICSLATERGWTTLFGDTLINYENGTTRRTEIADTAHRDGLISEFFGLDTTGLELGQG